MHNEAKLIQAIKSSFLNYKEHGARSTKKLFPIHQHLAEMLKKIWGDHYEIRYMGENNSEACIEGKYYPKNIDIAVLKDTMPVFCLGVKFITSNYKQNANNYFENMMGETANIQANKIPYAHFIILRYQTPYYRKNNPVTPSKIEIINEKDIRKYLELIYDIPQAHRPNELCLYFIDIDEQTNEIRKTNLNKKFDKNFVDLINAKLSMKNFLKQIKDYKHYYELEK